MPLQRHETGRRASVRTPHASSSNDLSSLPFALSFLDCYFSRTFPFRLPLFTLGRQAQSSGRSIANHFASYPKFRYELLAALFDESRAPASRIVLFMLWTFSPNLFFSSPNLSLYLSESLSESLRISLHGSRFSPSSVQVLTSTSVESSCSRRLS